MRNKPREVADIIIEMNKPLISIEVEKCLDTHDIWAGLYFLPVTCTGAKATIVNCLVPWSLRDSS